MNAPAYIELVSTSNFSFLRGGSHPEELVLQAAQLGLSGFGLCDLNSLAGVVRGYSVARDLSKSHPAFRYLVGARLRFSDGTPDVVAYPSDREAYGRLCHLLTQGNLQSQKGHCRITLEEFLAHQNGLLLIAVPPRDLDADLGRLGTLLARLGPLAGDRLWLGANTVYDGGDRARLRRLATLAGVHRIPLLATNDVLYHVPSRRPLQDVLTCIREHLTIEAAGRRLEKNAERHLKSPKEMGRLFHEHPQALEQTLRFAERISFSLTELKYNYPLETVGNGETAQQTLERLTWAGAQKRYPLGVPYKVKRGVVGELKLIAQKQYAPYFLTVHDLVRFAREERQILCQGRGSAANSMVCYCLGVTEVDPMKSNLVFGRFLSTERDEPPDIDVDFEHERREEVMQYLYEKYGRARTGLTANVVTYRSRGALREVGKVFGLSADRISALNGMSWGWSSKGVLPEHITELGLDPTDSRLRMVVHLTKALIGFPRHLSQHVGGFVITEDRLDHLIPITNAAMENRTVVEWNKDDLDTLEILKVDVLALGMLTCIRRAFELMHIHYGQDLTLDGVMQMEKEDDSVYRMTHRADTLGVFQIESRAQMSMLPRLQPKEFYDLVIEVAIVRPGPIQGGMVHPYLQRRIKKEDVTYPSEKLRAVLKRTLGVPLFQEQAMQIAIVGAGFSPGEADQLRRAMATWRRNGNVPAFRERFLKGMENNGYDKEFAESCFKQIEGFGEYGFPESHAASFALLVYVSCWLKCHYPDVFAAALLNSQPMGFYAPAQIVRDAREHGVEIRPVDINFSFARSTLEPGQRAGDHVAPRHAEMKDDIYSVHSVRLGFNQVRGLSEDHLGPILARRGRGYGSVRDLWQRTGIPLSALERLAEADAFDSIGMSRRQALWAVRGLKGSAGVQTLPLFAQTEPGMSTDEPDLALPAMAPGEDVIGDYRSLTLSLKGHPIGFMRSRLQRARCLSSEDLGAAGDGRQVSLAGLVLVRQRPGTASGVIFLTLEDETGHANVIVWPKVFAQNRRTVLGARVLKVTGHVQREGKVIHLIARKLEDLTPWLSLLSNPDKALEAQSEHIPDIRAANAVMPKGRNFH